MKLCFLCRDSDRVPITYRMSCTRVEFERALQTRYLNGSGEIPTLVAPMFAALLFGQASADGVQFFQPPVGGFLSQGSMVSQAVPAPMVPSAEMLRDREQQIS